MPGPEPALCARSQPSLAQASCPSAGVQAGAGWHRQAQAGTIRGWSFAAAVAHGGMGCLGVQGHHGEWAELLGVGDKGPGGQPWDGKLRARLSTRDGVFWAEDPCAELTRK